MVGNTRSRIRSCCPRKFCVNVIVLFFVLCFVLNTAAANGQEASEIQVLVNGQELSMDVAPYFYLENRVALPLRPVFEAFGAAVNWDQTEKRITVTGADMLIIFQAGKATAVANDQEIKLPNALKIANGRAMLPVSFFAEKLGFNVSWEEKEKAVLITENIAFAWDGGTYKGETADGIPNGQGTWHRPDGSRYEGEFKDGLFHGRGTMVNDMGMEYTGEWKEGSAHGRGTLIVPDALIYVGDWVNGLYHGQGTLAFEHGEEYVGEFKEGRPHGQGVLTYSDGTIEEGLWLEGEFQGSGDGQ